MIEPPNDRRREAAALRPAFRGPGYFRAARRGSPGMLPGIVWAYAPQSGFRAGECATARVAAEGPQGAVRDEFGARVAGVFGRVCVWQFSRGRR